MRRRAASIAVATLMLLAVVSVWPVWAQSTSCQLGPAFLMLRDLIGRDRAGECVGPMIRNEAGDINQPTTRGIMTFRTGDLVVAFSDGQTTWLYGPNGLESRPSGSRLAWETASTPVNPVSAGAVAPAPVALASPTLAVQSTLPIKLDGDYAGTTKPFDLPAGEFVVQYEANLPRGKSSCYVGAYLRRFEDQNPGQLLLHTTVSGSNDRSSTGETRLFDVIPGRYVLDVNTTGCTWKFTIQQ